MQVITIDHGGWDHHQSLPVSIATRGNELATGLQNFYDDLDTESLGDQVLALCVTEFGRTAWENSTDQAANLRPAKGEPTPSGHWPGPENDELHVSFGAPRDLHVSTSFRDVLAEVLTLHVASQAAPREAAAPQGGGSQPSARVRSPRDSISAARRSHSS